MVSQSEEEDVPLGVSDWASDQIGHKVTDAEKQLLSIWKHS